MSIKKRYMVWNNKGGVGKTFLTYALATEYAICHPEKTVAVVDMCPQANVSEMLLGGDGKGESVSAGFARSGMTIAGYIKRRYATSPAMRLGTESSYFQRLQPLNAEMPANLYLLPGDVDLDICGAIISYMGSAPGKSSWKNSRLLLDDLLTSFENAYQETVAFIDCNPSFATYTEMVALSARELVIPCTADNASIRGILNVFRLIYGINASSLFGDSQGIDDEFFTFAGNARENGFLLPRIRSILLNKSRSLDAKATMAWQAHRTQIVSVLSSVRTAFPDVFCSDIGTLVYDIKDGNTLATIANYTGFPISKITPRKYDIYGCETMANQTQIDALMSQLAVAVGAL